MSESEYRILRSFDHEDDDGQDHYKYIPGLVEIRNDAIVWAHPLREVELAQDNSVDVIQLLEGILLDLKRGKPIVDIETLGEIPIIFARDLS